MRAASRLTIINERHVAGPTHRKSCRIALRLRFAPNRRLADLERLGRDRFLGEAPFQQMQKAVTVGEPERHRIATSGSRTAIFYTRLSNNRSLRTSAGNHLLACTSLRNSPCRRPSAQGETASCYDQTNLVAEKLDQPAIKLLLEVSSVGRPPRIDYSA